MPLKFIDSKRCENGILVANFSKRVYIHPSQLYQKDRYYKMGLSTPL